jgi:hypothetical protein
MDQMLAAGLPQVVTLGGTALPLAGRARVYACGITPYDVTHLGHAATFVWVDTLARVLHADGTEVIVCRNVTDVDDVLLAAAGRAGSRYDEFAVIQQFYFDQDMTSLGVRQPAFTGVTPFARARLQAGVVGAAGAKMAKSAGNLVLVSDLLKVYPAAAIRLLILDRQWDQDWDYNQASLDEAAGSGFSGAAEFRERCGRCWLWWVSYWHRIRRRWAWFQMRVRYRSSRRHPPIQRSAIAFIRGVRTLHSTVRIPASARTASNAAV